MSRRMRLFIALNLPPAERRAVWTATAPLRDGTRGVSWVGEARQHLTMKFLGEQPAATVPALRDAMADVAQRNRALALELDGIGAFPNWSAPRVLWVGVPETPPLELLHHDMEAACAELGHPLDGRPFRSHVTIGRVKRPMARAEARALAATARAVRYSSVARVSTVDLMSSALSAAGPKYAVLAALPLRSD